jgi:hypothetical protein
VAPSIAESPPNAPFHLGEEFDSFSDDSAPDSGEDVLNAHEEKEAAELDEVFGEGDEKLNGPSNIPKALFDSVSLTEFYETLLEHEDFPQNIVLGLNRVEDGGQPLQRLRRDAQVCLSLIQLFYSIFVSIATHRGHFGPGRIGPSSRRIARGSRTGRIGTRYSSTPFV